MRSITMILAVVTATLLAFSQAPVVSAQPDLESTGECTPDTIRPNSEALFVCSQTITNNGDATATNVTLQANFAPEADLPSYTLFDRTVNGEPVPISRSQISFDFPDIAPGETVEAETRVIFGVGAAGTYGFSTELRANSTSFGTTIQTFEATPDSPYPPTDLTVTKTLVEVLPPPEDLSPPADQEGLDAGHHPDRVAPETFDSAQYEIVIRNDGDETVDSLTVWDRYSSGLSISADPEPAGINDATNIVAWELDGPLPPGDEQRIDVFLERKGECVTSGNTLVVSEGGDFYLAHSDDSVFLGDPCVFGRGGDGRGGPGDAETGQDITLPDTGAGDTGSNTSWWWLVLTVAAASAAVVIGGALAARRP